MFGSEQNVRVCSGTEPEPTLSKGQAGVRPFLLALTPALALGRLDPKPGGSGQGRVRADPGPLTFSSELDFFSQIQ